MIQILGFSSLYDQSFKNCNDIKFTTFERPYSFDDYNINIIDLQWDNIWRNDNNTYETINIESDFRSISRIISNSKTKNIIVILPKNYKFKSLLSGAQYHYNIDLKNMLKIITTSIVAKLINDTTEKNYLHYELTKTSIGKCTLDADFCFTTTGNDALTVSSPSNKKTTIKYNNIILTTLDILQDYQTLIDFLKHIKLLKDDIIEYPEWFKNTNCLDDTQQKLKLEEINRTLEKKNQEKETIIKKLDENNYYKSILLTNGDKLVSTVHNILEQILDCDLSDFIDNKKEDFLIEKENVTFIGEIKGVSTNVKSSNLSQLDVHYQKHLESLNDEKTKNKVKALLIINHQRDIPLIDRKPIDVEQINLAKRNGSLIIETTELLKLYELFLNKKLTSENCINIFIKEVGVFKL